MHEHRERAGALAGRHEAHALAIHRTLRAGEAVDLRELRRLLVTHVHPFGCNGERHFLCTQSAWCGAFFVLDHSASISSLTAARRFFISGVVVSTVSSSRWPFGSKK